ncbi:hypothetical protein HDE76_003657 [Rhodanobacter sp. ANJX3]|uniref:hypothetical protein n=1 Tax=Rhodanobacter sp. ANJX3 TaxID=2723083 RepID=UPI00161F1B6C|nr:hypothetical protein [Rhodanobacter sp. ANJX3]MBB5360413.1 hypothetical protein [Rhodanobacter sp. ANJX3]
MTLVEFLHPLKGSPLKDICLAAMYFHQRYEASSDITIESLRALLKRGRVPRAGTLNLADTISKSAPYVHLAGKEGKRFLWSLTSSGQDYVRKLLQLPANDVEVENDVATLKALISKVGDTDVSDYLEEALKCLQVNALRATVVFVWSGAVKKIRDDVFACGAVNVNVAVQKHDQKAKTINKVDDLVLIKEVTLLLASQELGLYDKNQKLVLEEGLNLRNKCGHAGKYKVGPKKVSSFIEDLISIVFK